MHYKFTSLGRWLAALCIIILPLLAMSTTPVYAATTITQWTFESSTLTPASGTGTATYAGNTTLSGFNAGNPSGSSIAAWNTTTYPAQGTNNKTAGVQFVVSTVGYENIVFTYAHRHSNTAANTSVVQYSTDGGANFIDAQTFTFTPAATGTGDTWYARTVDLSTITALDNNANVIFRIVSAFDPGTNTQYLASRSTSTYGTSSTWRFDDVTISGDSLSAGAAPTIVESTTTPFLNLPDTGPGAVSGVISDPTDPAATLGIDFTLADADTLVDNLTVIALSSNQTVVPNANLAVTGSGATRNLKITPVGVGETTITMTVTDPQANSATYTINYAASAAALTAATSRFHTGASDASTALALDADYMLVADDEDQTVRVFDRNESGLPVAQFDFTGNLALDGSSEIDVEGSTRVGNRIYWQGSHGNNSSGNDRPNRERIFSTDLSGTGAATTLTFVGFYRFLEDDLIAWDNNNGHGLGAGFFGLAASAAAGVIPETVGGSGFNIEGLSMAPGSTTVAYVAFRAPIVPTTARTKALIVPVTNFTAIVDGSAGAGSASFGAPLQLSLGGRGIRSLECNAGGCLISAGAADGSSNFALFTWSGNANDAPELRAADLAALQTQGSFESIVELPSGNFLGANGDALTVQLLSDNGDTVWYNNGTISKDLAQINQQKSRSDIVTLGAVTSDNGAPTIATLAPADEATNVAVASNLSLTFNENVQLNSGTIVIKKLADNAVVESFDVATSAQLAANGATVTINPSNDLALNTGYYVEIASGAIQDLAGNAFAGISGNSTWNFTTASGVAPLYDLQITEIWAGQSVTPLTGDWFEITNRGTGAWIASSHPALYYDDDSQLAAEADPISGIIQIDPGESVIVVIGTSASVATTFSTVWSPVLTLTDIGWVNGAGLGQAGDGVTLWVGGPAGTAGEFAAYPSLASGISYDVDLAAASTVGNASGAVATIATSGTEPAIGSPGRTRETTPPTVSIFNPADEASNVAITQDLVLTFNETVQKGVGNITIHLAADNSVVQTIAATDAAVTVSGAAMTINPPTDLTGGTAYYVNIAAGAIKDAASNNFAGISDATTWNFTTVAAPVITKISAIQGSGETATSGAFTVEAIVVGDYQTQGSGQLRGFFLQEEDADSDGNVATSEGIFVFCTTCPTAVAVGDKVQVTGATSEFFNMSQLTAATANSVTVLSSNNSLPSPATIQLPVPGLPSNDLATATTAINAYFEPFEGMLVTFPDTLAVSEYFELARYGQVILNEGGRPRQFTDANPPSTTGLVNHEIDLASRTVILDDTDNRQNRPVDTPNTNYYHPVPGLSTSNFFRGGDTITNLTGVLHWSFAGQTGTDAWRIRPVPDQYSYAFTPVNTRPAAPTVGGSLKVASFNVLNYFLTVDTTSSSSSGSCGASATLDCRGADNTTERDQQQTKLTAALSGLNADIFGLIELENTPNVDPLAEIVADLNTVAGAGTYAAINTGVVGTDAIKVGFIYKPSTVTPIGSPIIDNNAVHNRPPVAQLFEDANGGRFTVVINHFKSKSCTNATGANADQLDGQGCYNAQRVDQANALLSFVNTFTNQTDDPDVLIIGDLNAYAKEDPITTLQNGGFTNLVAQFGGTEAYSYVFDGQLGYLDHALGNASLTAQVTGVADWHINADEIPLFDYNDNVKDTGEAAFEKESDTLPLYTPNEFRTSDHDPVIVGLNLDSNLPRLTVIKTVVNDHGGTKVVTDFPLFVNGNPVASGATAMLSPGEYTVSETGDPGYAATFGGDCTATGQVTISSGDNKTCTLTNDDIAPQLIVTLLVTNDSGGAATPASFTVTVNGVEASPASFSGAANGTLVSLDAGSYSVSSAGLAGYTVTPTADCTGSIAIGETKQCTLNADDNAPVAQNVILSGVNNGNIGGLAYRDEDIIANNLGTNTWTLVFDGSDVGLGNVDVDAFAWLANGHLLLSVDKDFTLNNFGPVDDADILEFTPTALGPTTTGSYTLYFDGSDVGLNDSSEDIDAIGFAATGELLISVNGSFNALGVKGNDEDLFVLHNATFGTNTGGTWELYFDGSDVDLTASGEDIQALWTDHGNQKLYFATNGNYSLPGKVKGNEDDVVLCTYTALGATTACTFTRFWNGDEDHDFDDNGIDGLLIGAVPQINPANVAAASAPIDDTVEAAGDDADEVDSPDETEEAAEAETNAIFLPVVIN